MDGETLLLTNLSRYPLENVFNEEEFRLFYRCLPNKALHFKGDKAPGGSIAKFVSPDWLLENALEKLLHISGKAQKHRCF